MNDDEIAAHIQPLKNPYGKVEEYNRALNALIRGATEVIAPILWAATEPDASTALLFIFTNANAYFWLKSDKTSGKPAFG